MPFGMKVFGNVVPYGRQFGPHGSPTALKTHFGWVLSGTVNSEHQQGSEICCLVTTGTDDLLWRFWEIEDTSLPH